MADLAHSLDTLQLRGIAHYLEQGKGLVRTLGKNLSTLCVKETKETLHPEANVFGNTYTLEPVCASVIHLYEKVWALELVLSERQIDTLNKRLKELCAARSQYVQMQLALEGLPKEKREWSKYSSKPTKLYYHTDRLYRTDYWKKWEIIKEPFKLCYIGADGIGLHASIRLVEKTFYESIDPARSEPGYVFREGGGSPYEESFAKRKYLEKKELTVLCSLTSNAVSDLEELPSMMSPVPSILDYFTKERNLLIGEVVTFGERGITRDTKERGSVGTAYTGAIHDQDNKWIPVTNFEQITKQLIRREKQKILLI